jgi:nucleoside recognition membrane protein YjiH
MSEILGLLLNQTMNSDFAVAALLQRYDPVAKATQVSLVHHIINASSTAEAKGMMVEHVNNTNPTFNISGMSVLPLTK